MRGADERSRSEEQTMRANLPQSCNIPSSVDHMISNQIDANFVKISSLLNNPEIETICTHRFR